MLLNQQPMLLIGKSLTEAARRAFREEWRAIHSEGRFRGNPVLQTTGGVFLADEAAARVASHDATDKSNPYAVPMTGCGS